MEPLLSLNYDNLNNAVWDACADVMRILRESDSAISVRTQHGMR